MSILYAYIDLFCNVNCRSRGVAFCELQVTSKNNSTKVRFQASAGV
jgi:hypothetical protein